MLAVNITSQEVRFEIARGPGDAKQYVLGPGQAVDLDDAYCARLQTPGGPQPSVIEKLTGGMAAGDSISGAKVAPVTDPRAAAVLAAQKTPAIVTAVPRSAEARRAARAPARPGPSRSDED